MDYEKAINIAIGCVLTSYMDADDKRETIEALRDLEEYLEQNAIDD